MRLVSCCYKCGSDACAAQTLVREAARRSRAGEQRAPKFEESVDREVAACDVRWPAKDVN